MNYYHIVIMSLDEEVFMGFLSNLIQSAFQWALFLALVGGLGEATATLYKEAGTARAYGLVSLVRLNRSLVGDAGLPASRAQARPSSGRAQ
jgi:hypothetical protein